MRRLREPQPPRINIATGTQSASVFDEFLNGFVWNSHVGAEFLNSDELVGRFVKGGFDFMNKITAVALAFSGDALDVFGVNAEPGNSGFHRFGFLINKG